MTWYLSSPGRWLFRGSLAQALPNEAAVTGEQHRQTVKSLFPVPSNLSAIKDKALVTGLVKQTPRYSQHMALLIRYITLGVRVALIKSFPSLLME